MFKHDTMEKYVRDSLAASKAKPAEPFDFFASGEARVIELRPRSA